MSNLDAERRAWFLLQWVPYSLPSEFDEELAATGHYTRLQKQRSDLALDEFDASRTANAGGVKAAQRARETPDPDRTGIGSPLADAQQSRRAFNRSRRQRR